jgi:signal peptidase I
MSQVPGRPEYSGSTPDRTGDPGAASLDDGTVDSDPEGDLDGDFDDEGRRSFGAGLVAALKELLIVVVLAMALSFVVKTWLFQAFYIPSGSMENTLVRDDRVIVSKLTPGPFDLRRGDVVVFEDPADPFPWLSGAVTNGTSDVGGPLHDLLVFVGLLPEDAENHLIKRVIGLPGDHVVSDGTAGPLTVNGLPIEETYLKPGDAPSEGKAFDIVVPSGHVWVMGDHRSDSSDSRYHDAPANNGTDGSVPMDKIVGRALFIVWPIDHVTWLGVPERTFEDVPAPAVDTPEPSPTAPTEGRGTGDGDPGQRGRPAASVTGSAASAASAAS